jgi:two-component system, OmpR family, phosphate regulon sensor histidine kinase PhoR
VTLRRRFLLASAGVLALALLLVGLSLRAYVEGPRVESERDRIRASWETASRLLALDSAGAADPARFAPEMGALLRVRVTLVAPDGRVLGDSGVPGGDVRNMESHADRPEVRAALEGRTELLERRSPTQGIPILYVAGPVTLPGGAPAVLRVATPVGSVRGPLDRAPGLLLALGLAGLAALLVLLPLVLGSHERALARLEEGAVGMASGALGPLPPREALPSEFQPLGQALHRMADEVRGRTRELTRERDELSSLVDAIAEGVLALTEDARVLRMNRATAELLELGRPEPFAPVAALVRHPQLRDHLEESVVLPLPPREFQVGGRNLLVSAHLLEEGGSVITLLDMTELRRMEKIRRDFVANASHELKTPLTAMRGFAETLLDGDPPEPLRREFLESIRTNTLRLQNLVDDLLDLSRLESGAWRIQEEEVEVAASASEVWRELMQQHRERSVTFAVQGDAVALADAQALHQVFRNLMDNALRYTPDGGRIEVTITPTGPTLSVTVTDSGAGIPSSALPRIFERFYRVDPGRDRAAGGTGLGLAIVRHLVHSMGGEVGAESALGEGTTIRFTLPRVE